MEQVADIIDNPNLPANHQDAGDIPTDRSPPPTLPSQERPELPPLLNFYEAIKMTLSGFRITRLEWNDENIYGHLQDSWLALHKPDRKDYQWTISDGDMLAEDWVVIPERN